MKKILNFFVLVAVLVWPAPLFAATFEALVGKVLVFFDQVGLVLIGIAALLLVFGIVRYFTAGGDPTRLAEGGKVILWGVISLFVMVAMWGFVNILLNSLFPSTSDGFELSEELFSP